LLGKDGTGDLNTRHPANVDSPRKTVIAAHLTNIRGIFPELFPLILRKAFEFRSTSGSPSGVRNHLFEPLISGGSIEDESDNRSSAGADPGNGV
jgi:hypothetical protein